MGLIAGIIGIGAGIIGGIASAEKARASFEMQKESYQNQIDDYNADRKDLIDSYNLNMTHLTERADTSRRNLNWNIEQAGFAQKTTARSNAFSLWNAGQTGFEELSSMIASANRAIGTSVQSASMTGLRRSGSVAQTVEDTEETARMQVQSSARQIMASRSSAFATAQSDYLSYDIQMEQYRQNIMQVMDELRMSSAELSLSYQQNLAKIDQAIETATEAMNDMQWDGWDWFSAFLTGGGDQIIEGVGESEGWITDLVSSTDITDFDKEK